MEKQLTLLAAVILYAMPLVAQSTRPTMTYEGLTFTEGSGEREAFFTATLDRPAPEMIGFSFRGYSSPQEYNGANVRVTAAVTFEPGDTSKQVPLLIRGNDTYESVAKVFHFTPQPAMGNCLASDFEITLTEDDAEAAVSIDDVTVTEGSWGPTQVVLTLHASQPATGLVQWAMHDGTATMDDIDYGPFGVPEPIHFNNSDTATLTLTAAYGDLKIEPDETFTIELTSATNMTISDGSANVTIENDDLELPRFGEGIVRVEAGGESALRIDFPAPAPEGLVSLTSSNPAVTVPASVMVAERATFVVVPVTVADSVGQVAVTAHLAPRLGGAFLEATVDTFRDSPLHLDVARSTLFTGESMEATLAMTPPNTSDETITLTGSAGVSTPDSITLHAGQRATFLFTALAPGTQWITAQWNGGETRMFVDIVAHSLASLSPENGPSSGGSAISLRGNGFSPGCNVRFGDVLASSRYVTPGVIAATTPAHGAGRVNVTVTCGTTAAVLQNAFEFENGRRRAARH